MQGDRDAEREHSLKGLVKFAMKSGLYPRAKTSH